MSIYHRLGEWSFGNGQIVDSDTYDLLYQWNNGQVYLDEVLEIGGNIGVVRKLLKKIIESTEGDQQEPDMKEINLRAKRCLARTHANPQYREIIDAYEGDMTDLD